MGLQDQIAAVERHCYCSLNYFAESLVLFSERDERLAVTGHVNYRYVEENDYLVETCTVRLLREDLPTEPCAGWRLYRSGDEKAFLWSSRYEGRDARSTTHQAYRAVFVRRTQKRSGVR
jgi:hypothetical protein